MTTEYMNMLCIKKYPEGIVLYTKFNVFYFVRRYYFKFNSESTAVKTSAPRRDGRSSL